MKESKYFTKLVVTNNQTRSEKVIALDGELGEFEYLQIGLTVDSSVCVIEEGKFSKFIGRPLQPPFNGTLQYKARKFFIRVDDRWHRLWAGKTEGRADFSDTLVTSPDVIAELDQILDLANQSNSASTSPTSDSFETSIEAHRKAISFLKERVAASSIGIYVIRKSDLLGLFNYKKASKNQSQILMRDLSVADLKCYPPVNAPMESFLILSRLSDTWNEYLKGDDTYDSLNDILMHVKPE